MNRTDRRRLLHKGAQQAYALEILREDLLQVQRARERGERLQIEWALPTYFDAFLDFLEKQKVLDDLERLPDQRKDPVVPLLPLILVIFCRFLMGIESFAEVEGILFRHPEILRRLGFTVELLKEGAYPSTGKRPCDAERLSEVSRQWEWETIREVLVRLVKRMREQRPKLFAGGRCLVDSNHFRAAVRHVGAEQEGRVEEPEEKVCTLMLWTPHGLIPLDFRIARAKDGGEGETTCGQALIEAAFAAYGGGLIKELIWDRGYLDGAWLAQAEERIGFVWVMGAKEEMRIFEDAVGLTRLPEAHWVRAEPPKFDDPRKRPERRLCRVEGLESWDAYGKPLTGVVIEDRYPDRVTIQVALTPQTEWSASQIHQRSRCRWDLEEVYNEVTRCWRLGEKGLARRADIYRALVGLMVVLYALLRLFQASGGEKKTLLGYQREFKLGPTHLVARCGGYCAVVTLEELNDLLGGAIVLSRGP